MCQPPPSHNTSHMAYKSFTKLTVYSSTGCPPLSLSVTVTWTSLSDNALAATVPMTGAVHRERERECYEGCRELTICICKVWYSELPTLILAHNISAMYPYTYIQLLNQSLDSLHHSIQLGVPSLTYVSGPECPHC